MMYRQISICQQVLRKNNILAKRKLLKTGRCEGFKQRIIGIDNITFMPVICCANDENCL